MGTMGKSLLQSAAVFCACFIAGWLYLEWGSFEYNVPDERPVLLYSDGTPINP